MDKLKHLVVVKIENGRIVTIDPEATEQQETEQTKKEKRERTEQPAASSQQPAASSQQPAIRWTLSLPFLHPWTSLHL